MPNTSHRYNKNNALDRSFESQVVLLKNFVVNANEVALKRAIELWCLRLSKATDQEKHARNVLTVLMQNELNEKGTLSKNFLKVGNVRRNLNQVLQDINNDWQDFKSKMDTTKSESVKVATTPKSTPRSKRNENKDLEENRKLRRELEQMKLALEQCDLRAQELQLRCERQQFQLKPQTETSAQQEERLLKTFLQIIGKFLNANKNIRQKSNGALKLNMFLNIFSQLEIDGIGVAVKLKELDKVFESKVQAFIENERSQLTQKLNEKLENSSNKLIEEIRNDYLRQLKYLDWQSSTKLKLLKIKAYSKLRSVFLDLQSGQEFDIKSLLQRFENEFENLLLTLKLDLK